MNPPHCQLRPTNNSEPKYILLTQSEAFSQSTERRVIVVDEVERFTSNKGSSNGVDTFDEFMKR